MATCLYLAFLRLFGLSSIRSTLSVVGILLVVIGVQFLCVGILAEIQIRIPRISQKPTYAIRENGRIKKCARSTGYLKRNGTADRACREKQSTGKILPSREGSNCLIISRATLLRP
jgi:hypothetical protein